MIEDDHERDLVIADGVIADAYPIPGVEPDAAGWVLPGLADVHNHLSLSSPAGDHEDPDVRARASASVELALGVLAIREPGSPDDASTRLGDEDGWPRVITAGRFLAPPGGYFPGLAREVTAAGLPSAAEQEARRSGGWAKIIGDHLGPGGRFTAHWPADVLAAAAERVHAIGGRVAIHVTCPEAVDAAVAAGVDSIEHGWADLAFDVDLLITGRWQDAVELPTLGGELLEGLQFPHSPAYEVWLLGERRRLAAATEALLHEAALSAMSTGSLADAVRWANRLVCLNPRADGHQELLVRAYAISGDRAAARRQLESLLAGDLPAARTPAWHNEALATAQRSGMRSLARDLLQPA